MKQFFISAIFTIAMCGTATVSAQPGNGYYYRAIVASGGAYETTPPFTDYVTVKVMRENTIEPIGTVFTQSVQAVQGIGANNAVAVAAEDSLIIFSTASAINRIATFKMPDLYASFHSLYTKNEDFPTTLWAGKWYGSNSNFLFYYTLTPFVSTVQYGGTVAGVTHDVRGMAQIGDTLYVSQNIQNSNYTDSISFISRVLVSNKTFLSELGRNSQTRFFGVSELYAYNGKLYGVCQNTNRIIEYTPSTGATRTIVCGTASISKGLSWADNRLTVTQGSSVIRYNITTGALIEDLTCLVPTGESVVAGIDGFNTGAFSTLLSTTDYFSYGKTYTQSNGCMSTMANVGIAPEAMTIARGMLVSTENRSDNNLFGLAPNPTSDILNLTIKTELSGNITIKIVDILGRTMENTSYNAIPAQISLAYLPKGLYFVEIRTEKGVFIQKIEKI